DWRHQEFRRTSTAYRGRISQGPAPQARAMILTEAGPLVAILDRGEQHHEACVASLKQLAGPMVTTWPAFTEAMYLLGEAGGWRAKETLWNMLHQGDLEIAVQGSDDYERMRFLMQKYRYHPMDLA